jgi:hypothetical protein
VTMLLVMSVAFAMATGATTIQLTPGTLPWMAARARALGQSRVDIPVETSDVDDVPAEIVKARSVVTATIGQAPAVTTDDHYYIYSWHPLVDPKIEAPGSAAVSPFCSKAGHPAATGSSAAAWAFYIGGEANVDGVVLFQRTPGLDIAWPVGRSVLLLADLCSDGHYFLPEFDRDVYALSPDGGLSHAGPSSRLSEFVLALRTVDGVRSQR